MAEEKHYAYKNRLRMTTTNATAIKKTMEDQQIADIRKAIQEDYIDEITDSRGMLNIGTVFFRISEKIIRDVEKREGSKFKVRPKGCYYYFIDKTSIPKVNHFSSWAGFQVYRDDKDGNVIYCVVIIPSAFLGKSIREIILVHELTEQLYIQHGLCVTKAHEKALIAERMTADQTIDGFSNVAVLAKKEYNLYLDKR